MPTERPHWILRVLSWWDRNADTVIAAAAVLALIWIAAALLIGWHMNKLEDLPNAERMAWERKIAEMDAKAHTAVSNAAHWRNQLIAVLEGREPTCYPPGHPKLKEREDLAKKLRK